MACNSNEICMDIKTQTLQTVDNVAIFKLYLEEKEGVRVIKIEKKKGREASDLISLTEIDTVNYNLFEVGAGDQKIRSFSFTPNSTWNIDHTSIGDAAPGELTISVDANGDIVSASKTCN